MYVYQIGKESPWCVVIKQLSGRARARIGTIIFHQSVARTINKPPASWPGSQLSLA
jgi:hypothetical protein